MENLVMVNIDGAWVNLPTPSEYEATYTHIENSYRDIKGNLHRDFVRKNLAKVNCGWNCLDDENIALLQSIYTYSSIKVRFTDNFGNRVERTMYAGPLSRKSAKLDKTTLKIVLTTEIAMNFIEV